jgi:hypothetical protein
VELRVVRFHLVEHRLAPASDDDLVAEFEELEGESKSDAGGASGDEDSATFEIHKIPFMSVVRGNTFSFWRTDLSARHESCFLDLVRLYGMMLII